MTDRELMQQALEALEAAEHLYYHVGLVVRRQEIEVVITALRERLADNTVHSCSYYCTRPDCVRAQRDELRERLARGEFDPVAQTNGDPKLDANPARQEQEPVAWLYRDYYNTLKLAQTEPPPANSFPVYTAPQVTPQVTPQQREWVGLTDEEMHECWDSPLTPLGMKHVRAIEAKLKERNT